MHVLTTRNDAKMFWKLKKYWTDVIYTELAAFVSDKDGEKYHQTEEQSSVVKLETTFFDIKVLHTEKCRLDCYDDILKNLFGEVVRPDLPQEVATNVSSRGIIKMGGSAKPFRRLDGEYRRLVDELSLTLGTAVTSTAKRSLLTDQEAFYIVLIYIHILKTVGGTFPNNNV